MERSGQLSEAYSFYANKAKDFYKVGDAANYSCLSYVIRNKNTWEDLYTSDSAAITQLRNYGCQDMTQPGNPGFVLYGCGEDYVSHILIIEWNLVKSKWGSAELVRHSKLDVFFDYGHPFMFFTDPFVS